jgi:hypothetical protein
LATIVEAVTNPQTLSIILELATLFFMILGFFRWYDAKYTKIMDTSIKGINERFDQRTNHVNDKLENLQRDVEQLSQNLYKFMEGKALGRRSGATKSK